MTAGREAARIREALAYVSSGYPRVVCPIDSLRDRVRLEPAILRAASEYAFDAHLDGPGRIRFGIGQARLELVPRADFDEPPAEELRARLVAVVSLEASS